MTRLKGMMSSKKVLILLSAVVIISLAGMFAVFISAQGPVLTVRVSDIVNNGTITSNPLANVTIWNC